MDTGTNPGRNPEKKYLKLGLDLWVDPCYIEAKQGRNGSPTYPDTDRWEVVKMTITEVLELLTLLAVVIFGVIEVTKK